MTQRSVNRFSSRWVVFSPRAVRVGRVMDLVEMEKVFSPGNSPFPFQCFLPFQLPSKG